MPCRFAEEEDDDDDDDGAESVGGLGRGFEEKVVVVVVVVVLLVEVGMDEAVGLGEDGTKEGRACWRMLADTMLLYEVG